MKLFKHHGFRSAIALGAICAIALAACGGDDDDSAGSTSAGNDTTTTASGGSAAGAAVTLDQECDAAKAKGVKAPAGFNVRLVTDVGRIDDGTFNQYSYDAMEAAKKCFGFETSYIETTSEADYAKNIATTLAANPNVIITNGFLLADDTLAAAEGQPRRRLHRHRPVPADVPGELHRRARSVRTRAATSPASWRLRSARAASSASSAAARTSRRSSGSSTGTRPVRSR